MDVVEPRRFAHRIDQGSLSPAAAGQRHRRRPVRAERLPAGRHHRVLARLPAVRRRASFRVSDELYSVSKISVSADGKKMTEVVDNKQTGRVSTYIDEKQ